MSNAYDAGWAEFRFAPIRSLDVQAGVRVETGDSLRNGGDTRVSPRFSVRWQPTSSTNISAGWGRSFQYSQAIGASGGPLGPQLHIGNLWILSNIGFPALRSDIYVVGAERWLPHDWLLTANSYHRTVDGVAEPDPTPGAIRPDAVFFAANQVARGVEISARKLTGSWTAMLGYAYGDATTEVLEFTYPSQADIRHSFDATAGYRFINGLRIGAAFAFSTGIPYTRVLVADVPALGEPNAHRTPAYVGFDMVIDYATSMNGWEIDLYAQLLNVFNRANRITYSGSRCLEEWTTALEVGQCSQVGVFDELKAGLPRLPLFGIRIAF
jgi:outer membrane receptor protein involved in Fe transport